MIIKKDNNNLEWFALLEGVVIFWIGLDDLEGL